MKSKESFFPRHQREVKDTVFSSNHARNSWWRLEKFYEWLDERHEMNEVGIKRMLMVALVSSTWKKKKREKKKEGKIRERVVLFGKFARCLPSDSRIRFHGAVGTLGLSRSSTFHLVGTKCLSSTKRAERIPKVQLSWIFCTNRPNLLNFQLKYINET